MADFAMRLVAYNAQGRRIQILPDVLEMDLGVKLNDDSTLKFKYAADGVGAELFTAEYYLVTQLEIAVEVTGDGGVTWTEPPIGRFLVSNGSKDLLTPGITTIDVETRCNTTRLADTVLLLAPTSESDDEKHLYVDENLKAHFHNVTPGFVLRTMWDSAQSRLWGPDLTTDLAAATDSSGTAWAQEVSSSFAAGTTLRAVLDELTDGRAVDWRMEGRTLHAYNPSPEVESYGVMGPVYKDWTLPLAGGFQSAEEEYSWAEQCSRVIVEGEESRYWLVDNPYPSGEVRTGLRQRFREIYLKASGVEDAQGARRVAEPYFLKGAAAAETLKRSFRVTDMLRRPLTDFQVGSWVLLERAEGAKEFIRVQAVNLSWDGMTATGDLTLGTARDGLLEQLLKKALTVDENGVRVVKEAPETATAASTTTKVETAYKAAKAAQDGGESAMRQLDELTEKLLGDHRSEYYGVYFGTVIPTAPRLTVGDYYTDMDNFGNDFGYCRLEWTHDGKDLDGKALIGNAPQAVAAFVYDTTTGTPVYKADSYVEWRKQTGGTVTGLEPGHSYSITVRAYYVGGWSVDSNAVTGTCVLDTTPPPVPSVPAVSTAYQALQITWDGLAADGNSGTPRDFDHLGVAVVAEGGVLRETYTTDGPAGRVVTLANLRADTYDVAIRSWDKRGNVSGWSNRATVEVTVTVDTQAIQASVDRAMAAYDDSIGAAIDFASAIQNLSSSFIEIGEVPPDSGNEGQSYWQGPDGKVWKLKTLVTE